MRNRFETADQEIDGEELASAVIELEKKVRDLEIDYEKIISEKIKASLVEVEEALEVIRKHLESHEDSLDALAEAYGDDSP